MGFARLTLKWMEDARQDLGFAWRTLIRSRSFVVAVISLALALGTTSAVRSNADWLLNRPPSGVSEPEQLVTVGQIYAERSDSGATGLTGAQFDGLKEVQDGFVGLSAYYKVPGVFSTETMADQVVLEFVEGSYFSVLGLPAALGRVIRPEDDLDGGTIAGMLSHRLWTSAFGADPGILDRLIRVNGQSVRIVGILPQAFEGFSLDWGGPSSIILPLESGEAMGGGFLRAPALTAVGRMRPGVSLQAVRDRAEFWFSQLPPANLSLGPTYLVLTPTVETRLSEVGRQAVEEFLGGLLVVSALVLLGAGFNIANVFIGRSLRRGRELAMRAALGASLGRLIRQMAVEILVFGATAGVLSVAVGALVARMLSPLPGSYLAIWENVTPLTTASAFDTRTVLATVLLGFACVAVFGLLPAVAPLLRSPFAVTKSASAQWGWSKIPVTPRHIVLVLQIGLSVGIGIVAGLYGRSFLRVALIEPDYADPNTILIARILPPLEELSFQEGEAFYRDLRSRLEATPQVVSFSIGWEPPYLGGRALFRVPGDDTRQVEAGATAISPRFFETHGVPVVAGREYVYSEEDADGVIVNQTLAALLWSNDDVVGRTVLAGPGDGAEFRVIGVAADEHCNGVLGDPAPCVWRRFSGGPPGFARIRTRGNPMEVLPVLRDILRDLHPDAVAATPTTMQSHIDRLTAGERTAAASSAALAGLALILVALGTSSLFLAMVLGSVQEIAIRMALGAGAGRVASRIVLHGLFLTVAGIVLGLLLARWASSRLVGQLYEIGMNDLVTYVSVPIFVAAISLGAVGYAAVVATRTQPMRYLQGG